MLLFFASPEANLTAPLPRTEFQDKSSCSMVSTRASIAPNALAAVRPTSHRLMLRVASGGLAALATTADAASPSRQFSNLSSTIGAVLRASAMALAPWCPMWLLDRSSVVRWNVASFCSNGRTPAAVSRLSFKNTRANVGAGGVASARAFARVSPIPQFLR